MSVRYLAQELYRLTRTIEDLEKALKELEDKAAIPERVRVESELRQARQERDRVRAVLEAKKEPPKI